MLRAQNPSLWLGEALQVGQAQAPNKALKNGDMRGSQVAVIRTLSRLHVTFQSFGTVFLLHVTEMTFPRVLSPQEPRRDMSLAPGLPENGPLPPSLLGFKEGLRTVPPGTRVHPGTHPLDQAGHELEALWYQHQTRLWVVRLCSIAPLKPRHIRWVLSLSPGYE